MPQLSALFLRSELGVPPIQYPLPVIRTYTHATTGLHVSIRPTSVPFRLHYDPRRRSSFVKHVTSRSPPILLPSTVPHPLPTKACVPRRWYPQRTPVQPDGDSPFIAGDDSRMVRLTLQVCAEVFFLQIFALFHYRSPASNPITRSARTGTTSPSSLTSPRPSPPSSSRPATAPPTTLLPTPAAQTTSPRS